MAHTNLIIFHLCLFHATHSAIYEIFGNNSIFMCKDAIINDTCIIHCNYGTPSEIKFNCSAAGNCYFYCEYSQCLKSGALIASSSTNLYVYGSGRECFEDANIYTAKHNYFKVKQMNSREFRRIHIHSDHNTHSIYINCTGDDTCNEITVKAQRVTVLEIISREGILTNATVHCPQNSNYSGLLPAPCVIDFSAGGVIEGGSFYTLNGIPKDIMIYGELQNIVTIYCSTGSSINALNSFRDEGDCWITSNSTANIHISTTALDPLYITKTTYTQSVDDKHLWYEVDVKTVVIILLVLAIGVLCIVICCRYTDIQQNVSRSLSSELAPVSSINSPSTKWTQNAIATTEVIELNKINIDETEARRSSSISKSIKTVVHKLNVLSHPHPRGHAFMHNLTEEDAKMDLKPPQINISFSSHDFNEGPSSKPDTCTADTSHDLNIVPSVIMSDDEASAAVVADHDHDEESWDITNSPITPFHPKKSATLSMLSKVTDTLSQNIMGVSSKMHVLEEKKENDDDDDDNYSTIVQKYPSHSVASPHMSELSLVALKPRSITGISSGLQSMKSGIIHNENLPKLPNIANERIHVYKQRKLFSTVSITPKQTKDSDVADK